MDSFTHPQELYEIMKIFKAFPTRACKNNPFLAMYANKIIDICLNEMVLIDDLECVHGLFNTARVICAQDGEDAYCCINCEYKRHTRVQGWWRRAEEVHWPCSSHRTHHCSSYIASEMVKKTCWFGAQETFPYYYQCWKQLHLFLLLWTWNKYFVTYVADPKCWTVV